MKFVIIGGHNSLRALVTKHLKNSGHDIVNLSRKGNGKSRVGRGVKSDGKKAGGWVAEIDGADVLVNFADMPGMHSSREDTARTLLKALLQSANPPHLWLNIDINTPVIHAHTLDTPQTRRIALRSGYVVETEPGDSFDSLMDDGEITMGKQWSSWIHEKDYVGIIDFLVERTDISGIVNVCAPDPVTQQDFIRTLRGKAGLAYVMPLPSLLGRLSDFLHGSKVAPERHQVLPTRLLNAGYEFIYPRWESAAEEVVQVWKTQGYPRGWLQKMLHVTGEMLSRFCGDTLGTSSCYSFLAQS